MHITITSQLSGKKRSKMKSSPKEKRAPSFSDERVSAFVEVIIDFYQKCGRHDLPWRKDITPYKVLVSEIMLQQTQVERVIPKYNSWLKSYRTLGKLSSANLRQILTLWQGLGYQRRAKALLTIAQNNKTIPKVFERLLDLPGVGEYTASAVMAFAYDTFSHPVIETNIRTVLIEYFYPKKKVVTDESLRELLKVIQEREEVGNLGARHWYYALMDYGAHLKSKSVSHNKKSSTYKKQSKYKGSQRELRARALFAITHGDVLPKDEKLETVLNELLKEKFIEKTISGYRLV